MKWIAVGLAAVAVFGCLSDAQFMTRPFSKPAPVEPEDPRRPPTQTKNTFELPLTWRYPSDPTLAPDTVGAIEGSRPAVTVTVAVACENNNAHVEVQKDFFGTGFIINPADLTLGTCHAVGEDTQAQVLIFDSELEGCDSELEMTEDALIYSFNLNYAPSVVASNAPVVRTGTVAVVVECHYPRKHNVSSQALNPHWVPFSAAKVVDELLYFSLKLMTDNWLFVKPGNKYYLGDLIKMQASVQQYMHVPLRVYVDSCVVTVSPDPDSNPRYAFIANDGCMVDAALTGSSSCFMDRTADNKLSFQLEAFRFQAVETDTFYITCHLTATSAAHPINSENRACSYVNGWKEAGGQRNNEACNSCGQGIVLSGSSGSHGGSGGRLSDPRYTSTSGFGQSLPSGGSRPSTSGSYPSTGGSYPSTGGSYPSTGGSYHSTGGSQPSTGGSYPSTGGSYHSTGGSQPSTGGSYPSTGGSYPSTGGSYHSTGGSQPSTGGSHSSTGGSFPSTGGSFKPSTSGLKPITYQGGRKSRDVKDEPIVWEGTVGLGPVTILHKPA